MTKKILVGNFKILLKVSGLIVAVVLSFFFAGAGSFLSGHGLDLGDPIPGHCAYEDPGSWVTEDGGCKDVATGVVYSWWSKDTMNPMTQVEAIDYCENLVEANYDDWMLPPKDVLVVASENGAHGHLNFDTYNNDFVSSSKQGKKWVWFVWLYTGDSIALHPDSTTSAVCARNLPEGKPPKKIK